MLNKIKQYILFCKLKIKYKKNGTILYTYNVKNDLKLGKNCLISKKVILEYNVEIGDYTYLNSSKYWITVESNVKIGKYCSIAPGVHIGAGNHNYNYVTTHPILFNKFYDKNIKDISKVQKADGLEDKNKETIIGNDVWIGLNAIIKRGIKIGNGAVIAAGAVVVKDVPDYAIVGGNPARIIKYRTSQENIEILKLQEEKWWDWDKEKIKDHIDYLYDFDKYVKYVKSKKNK